MFSRKIVFITFFILISSITSCSSTMQSENNPKIVAHRGKACGYPESSLSGFKQVLRNGVDYIEIDVRTTSDGILVILHDGRLNRTTRSKGQIKDLSFRELQQVTLKRKFRGNKNEKIPTLEQVCKLISAHNHSNNKPVNLYVDCKDADPVKLINILEKYDLKNEAVFYGSDSYLKKLREVMPNSRIIPALKSMDELEKKLEDLSPYGFDTKWKILNGLTVKQIHAKNVKIYTDLLFINDRRSNYKKAQKWGVDAIQTDRMKKAKKAFR
jgi:glycerophosphoryl diester phosphodiesterase